MGRKTDTHAAPELLLRRFLFVRSIEKFYLKESSIMVFGLLKDCLLYTSWNYARLALGWGEAILALALAVGTALCLSLIHI